MFIAVRTSKNFQNLAAVGSFKWQRRPRKCVASSLRSRLRGRLQLISCTGPEEVGAQPPGHVGHLHASFALAFHVKEVTSPLCNTHAACGALLWLPPIPHPAVSVSVPLS